LLLADWLDGMLDLKEANSVTNIGFLWTNKWINYEFDTNRNGWQEIGGTNFRSGNLTRETK